MAVSCSNTPLQWRHNGHGSISNHQPHDCLLNRLFKRRSKKTSKLCVTGLCVGNSRGTGEFPAQMASNTENVSIWLRHHAIMKTVHVNLWGQRCSEHIYIYIYLLSKAQVTLCRSFFADVPDHSRPPRLVMIVTKPSDCGHNSRSLSVQDYLYDLSTTTVRHWYDGTVWSALSTFSTTISTTTDTIDLTAVTVLTTTPTLLPICYHD